MSAAALVVDLAAPARAVRVAPGVTEVHLTFLWGDRAVGEHRVRFPGTEQRVPVPAAIVRRAREAELEAALRPELAPAPAEGPTVSVVVCTLGRSRDLDGCLRRLSELSTAPYEVIVVDNDPAGRPARPVAERWGARLVEEPRRGLSAARNAGIRASNGDVIAFIDDDCEVAPSWLDDLGADFADARVAAVVGYVGPLELRTHAQRLFELQGGFQRHYEQMERDGLEDGPWAASGFGDGNAFFRRSVFEREGGLAEALGPGTPARSAQDAELIYRVLASGCRVRFSPRRVAWHRHREDLPGLASALEGYTTGLTAHAAVALLRRRDLRAVRYLAGLARGYFGWLLAQAWREREPDLWRLLARQVRGALLGPWRGRAAVGNLRVPAIAPRGRPGAAGSDPGGARGPGGQGDAAPPAVGRGERHPDAAPPAVERGEPNPEAKLRAAARALAEGSPGAPRSVQLTRGPR